MNPAAQALGRLGKGHAKTITEADRQRRRDWARGLVAIRKARKEKEEAAEK
jgi:hypothetical protein